MSFDACLAKVLEWEGAYDNDPDDSGGETCFGITRKYQAEWAGWAVVERLKAAQIAPSLWKSQPSLVAAVNGYYRSTWDRHRLDELPIEIQGLVFGGVVNQGPRVVKFLQECLTKLGQPADADGVVGQQTIDGCKCVKLDVLWDLLWAKRVRAYIVAAKKGNNGKYLLGWANRIEGGA